MSRSVLPAVVLFASLGMFPTVFSTTAGAKEPAPDAEAAAFEVDFLTSMIDHHFMAVMMGETCQDKAVHKELRKLCKRIETTQSREIRLMQRWLRKWYDIQYEPQMTEEMEQQLAEMESLDGAEYEIAFLTHMIEHHEGALEESAECVEHAYHEELVELCMEIAMAQSQEIELMQDWLCDWYDMCTDNGHDHAG